MNLFFFSFLIPFFLNSNNNFIENDFFSVEMSFSLIEETKKKNIYEINFKVVNKLNKSLYYVSSYEKIKDISQANDLKIDTGLKINISGGEQSAPPPLSSSAYQDSGGVETVDSEPARISNSNKVITQESKLSDNKNFFISDVNYKLKNDFFEINLENTKNGKFLSDLEKTPNRANFIKSKEKFKQGIIIDNLTDKNVILYENISNYNPVICLIPSNGLIKKTILETNKKNGINPKDFYLTFSKNKINISKLTLELDMTFHESIDEATNKFLELQKVLKESL